VAAVNLLPSRYARPDKIATGGMGEIYLAEDETLGRRVAIKLLAERYSRDEAIRRRFTREALAAARLSGHPHIVTIFDVGEADGGRPFIVMEYLPGGTVADRARSGRVSHEQALAWLRQSADALDEAHRRGIVHRDVKPANLLLDERGSLKVGDFGIARVVDETTSGMTLAGTVLGTAGYLSPEQARGEPATAASDIYGLGVVAFELLTGGRPFEGGSATAEAAAHLNQPVPRASGRGVGLSAAVDAAFEQVLAKDPRARYHSASAFVDALSAALTVEGTRRLVPGAAATPIVERETRREPRREAVRPEPGGRPPRREESRSRAWLPLLGVLLAGLMIAGVVLAATLGDDEPREAQEQTAPAAAPVTVEKTLPGTTVEATVTVTTEAAEEPPPAPEPAPTPTPPPAGGGGNLTIPQARALTDEATAAMRAGDYERAYALAEEALATLRGTGDIYEAYAYYDAGRSLAELRQCPKALDYLNRSERIQGRRTEIDQARANCS
jgi:tRNA A-37 threonylcarbamoyl transferase component Bud32